MRDTYKYWFKIGNLKVHCGITDNLKRREYQHRISKRYSVNNGVRYYWSNGHIKQEGNITTKRAAMEWERKTNCNANWN